MNTEFHHYLKYGVVSLLLCAGLTLQACQGQSIAQSDNKTQQESVVKKDRTAFEKRQGYDPYADTDYSVPEDLIVKRDGVDYGKMDDQISYYSSTAGEDKECGVLLPAGYNENQEYPVIYVLHGNGGDHYDWNREDSYLQTLYGNMVADGTTVPAIVVMVDMWSFPKAQKENATINLQLDSYDAFYQDLGNDLMPYIQEHYSAASTREGTAIIGTSQGGTEAMVAGYKLMDRIGYIGALAPCSGVIYVPGYREDAWNTPVLDSLAITDAMNTPYLIQLTVGDKDPWCLQSTIYYDQVMKEEGITHNFYTVPGLGHEDGLWENGMYQFFQQIF